MGDFKIFTWNMRGATIGGDPKVKVDLLEDLILGSSADPEHPDLPVFFLQEAGDLQREISSRQHWRDDYTFLFAKPIGAVVNRCTTGLMIPKWLNNLPCYGTCSQASGVRSYVTASVQVSGINIMLASIHAVATDAAAADGIEMLRCCCGNTFFVAGGDFNCSPNELLCERNFTERQREQGYQYDVMNPGLATHRNSSTGEESTLDFICVKGLRSSSGECWFGAKKRSEMYSDHWPILYKISF